LSQAQFSNEQILIRIESIEHRVDSAPVSHVGQVFSVLQRSDQQLPLRTDLPDFCMEAVAKSSLNGADSNGWASPVSGKVDIPTRVDKSTSDRRHNLSEIKLRNVRRF
jgi:hypothetical protein